MYVFNLIILIIEQNYFQISKFSVSKFLNISEKSSFLYVGNIKK